MNKNLIVFLKDGSKKLFFSVPDNKTEEEIIMPVLEKEGYLYSDVEGFKFVSTDKMLQLSLHAAKLDLNGNLFNEKSALIEEKLREMRVVRNVLLKANDTPYRVAIEKGDIVAKTYIEKKNNFLRNLPNKLNFSGLTGDQIIGLNPFNNIFHYKILKAGSNYNVPPVIFIEAPINGFAAKAQAVISNGLLVNVLPTDEGCGYNFLPKITVSPPSDGEQAEIVAEIDNIVV